MTATEDFIKNLTKLKEGDLGLLRTHAGQGLDESVDGFDLFTGLWWPLREKSPRAPRRSVAWMIAKLYAFCPIIPSSEHTLAHQLRCCQPNEDREKKRFQQKFDEMLMLTLDKIEPALRWALDQIASRNLGLNWAKMTDDLSFWEREATRLKWAEEFLHINERSHEDAD